MQQCGHCFALACLQAAVGVAAAAPASKVDTHGNTSGAVGNNYRREAGQNVGNVSGLLVSAYYFLWWLVLEIKGGEVWSEKLTGLVTSGACLRC